MFLLLFSLGDITMGASKSGDTAVGRRKDDQVALEPAIVAVGVPPSADDARSGSFSRGELCQDFRKLVTVVRMKEALEVGAEDFADGQAKDALNGLAAKDVFAVCALLPDPILHGIDDVAETLFALANLFLSAAPAYSLAHFAKSALNGGHKTRRVALQHVVDRAASQGLNHPLFANGRREKDEGRVGEFAKGDIERRQSIEAGHGDVRENEVWPELAQRVTEGRFGVHAKVRTAHAAANQPACGQFRFRGSFVGDQYPEALQQKSLPDGVPQDRPSKLADQDLVDRLFFNSYKVGAQPKLKGGAARRSATAGSPTRAGATSGCAFEGDTVVRAGFISPRATEIEKKGGTAAGRPPPEAVQSSEILRKSTPSERSLR